MLRFSLAVAHEQVDETGLDAQPDLGGRTFDRLAQPLAGERRDEVQTALGQPGEVDVDPEVGDVIGAYGQHHRSDVDCVGSQPVAERPRRVGGPFGEDEHLLELVDDEHR